MSVEIERRKRLSLRKGHVVNPQPASDQSTMQNVLEFLHDYVPQAVGVASKDDCKERVLWVRFELGDVNDITMCHNQSHDPPPLLLILGLATGYSLWVISPGGDARELVSCHNDTEPARVVRLLKTPDSCVPVDKFSNQRPLLAVVKKGRHGSGSTVAYSTIQMMSLRCNEEVRKISFKTRPIMDIHCNRRVIVIVFQKRLVVLDAGTLDNKFVIKNNYPSTSYPCNPVALGTRWLAFSETKLSSRHQSIGGLSVGTSSTVATTVLKNVKRGITALTETIQGLAGKAQPVALESADTAHRSSTSSADNNANIVTVVDVLANFPQEVKVQELDSDSGVIVHFLAHSGQEEHIAALQFNPSGSLLLTASSEGNNFHLFQILAHPTLSAESAVHHLYTLYRGATSGVVQDVCFSPDSRWVAVSTLNATTHVFPITPYGGDITVRTHTSAHVVNKLSRFHTSAGMETMPHSNTSIPSSGSGQQHQSSPPSSTTTVADTLSLNTVLPMHINALHLIKQPYLSPPEFTGGSVSPRNHDNKEPFITLAGPEAICVAGVFTSTRRNEVSENSASYSLYIMGSNGVLTEHFLQPVKVPTALEGDDAPIQVLHKSKLCWKLLEHSPSAGSIALPLSEDNPLIIANNEYAQYCQKKITCPQATDGQWLSQVEILTHAPPTRRLWMGPQFSFKTYHSSLCPSGAMKTPSPPTTTIFSDSPDKKTHQSAVLQTSDENPLVDFLTEPTNTLDSVILKSLDTTAAVPMATCNEESVPGNQHDAGVLEVFGSWNKVAPHLESGMFGNEVTKQLDDAMKEDSPVTIVTSDSVARTGFSPPQD